MTAFENDLAFGELYQRIYINELDLSGWRVIMPSGYLKEYDIQFIQMATNKDSFVEVKVDRKTKDTGNLAIEFRCNGVPSGITTTKAHWWIHFVHTQSTYYKIPVSVLRRKIQQKKFLFTTRGGDGRRAELYVFPKDSFERYKHTTSTPC